jgi:hypothetical protein
MTSNCSSECIPSNQWRFARSCAGWLASLCFIANALAQTGAPSLPALSSGTLQLWLKADAGVITNASGQVSQWQDQSGNANHASQANANNQPLLVYPAGLGGRAALRFNGIQDGVNGDYLHGTGSVDIPNAMTAFAVHNAFSDTNAANVAWLVGVPGTVYGASRSDNILYQQLDFSTWAYNSAAPWDVPLNTYRICTDRVGTNLSTVQIFDTAASGETDFTLAMPGDVTAPAAGYYVGGIDPSLQYVSPDNWCGDIAEVVIYSGDLSENDRLAVLGYLEQKYGLVPAVPTAMPLPPVSSGTLQLWLKADAGVFTNASGQVSLWLDQSGNANNAVQVNPNNQPSLVSAAGLGGMAALRFNGIQDNVNGDYLSSTGNVGVPSALTTFAVYNSFSNEANGNVIWAIGQPPTYGALRCDTIYDDQLYFSTWTYDYPFPFLVATNTYRIWTTALNSNLTSVQVYDNTATTATNFSATVAQAITPAPGYYVGGLNPAVEFVGSSRCFDGDIVELICYNGYLSEEDRLAVLGYLEQKYYAPCVPYPATATATVVNGFVVGVTLTDGGCGYTNAPAVSLVGGDGTGATAIAVVTNGVVVGITITDAGTGYTNAPTVDITPPAGVPPPTPVPFTNSLVAYYPFDGNANDATGHGNNGQIIGDVVPATDRFGNPSSAYHFDGSASSAVEVTNTLFNIGQTGYTVTGWFASDNVTANLIQIIFNTIPETGMGVGYSFDGWGYFGYSIGPANGTWTEIVKGKRTNYANQTWYQFVFEKSGTSYTAYIDGQVDSQQTIPAAAGYNADVGGIIGSITPINPAFVETFLGRLDDIRIYNRALSSNEVQELYAYESVPEGGPCVPYPATATATVVNGFVVGVTLTDGGCGYTNTPVVLLVGGGGTGATATALVTNGVVVGITITDAGTGYTSTPTVLIYSSIISSQIGLIRAVIPTFSSLSVGLSYQLQVSSGLNTWTNYGSSFVATNAALIYPQYFNVTNWDQLFFRLLGSP